VNSPEFLGFRIDQVVNISVHLVGRSGRGSFRTGMGLKETEGTSVSAVAALFILMTVDLFMIDCGDTFGAPETGSRGWPKTIIGPVLLAVTMPTILEAAGTIERKVFFRLATKTEFATRIFLQTEVLLGTRGGVAFRFVM
jgi:hypothetical protein